MQEMTMKKALSWMAFWVSLAVAVGLGIYFWPQDATGFLGWMQQQFGITGGHQKALEYFAGYVIEMSLSLDNLFLFLIIFGAFGIPTKYQRRVLNYGIMGAVILRLIFIVLGVKLVESFAWVLPIFGLLLIFSGFQMFFKEEEETRDFSENKVIKALGKIIPITDKLEGEKFFVKQNGIRYATPLLAILVLIESSDIIFAIDSIPAIFSVTQDPVIIYTSNIFAIMGLRSFYFLVEKLQKAFHLVKYGVAAILVFTGIKLGILIFHMHISIEISLAVIFGLLLLSILASVVIKEKIPESKEAE